MRTGGLFSFNSFIRTPNEKPLKTPVFGTKKTKKVYIQILTKVLLPSYRFLLGSFSADVRMHEKNEIRGYHA